MDILVGMGAEIGPRIRYRMTQEVKLRRDETLQRKREDKLKKLADEERRNQNQVEIAIRDRLEKRKETHASTEL